VLSYEIWCSDSRRGAESGDVMLSQEIGCSARRCGAHQEIWYSARRCGAQPGDMVLSQEMWC
jgi:hypothetical protein